MRLRRKTLLVTAMAASVAVASLSSCGRKGDLDPPSVAANPALVNKKTDGKTPPAPSSDKPFFLDPLL